MKDERPVLCPWCNEQLELGVFRSRGGNYFLPLGESVPITYSKSAMSKKRAIPLPPSSLSLPPDWPEAYVCRRCKKIIIPY
ncbi:MAG: PF20097 family protein [Caldicoprobacterales bacterium]|jgi:hypothetical protein